ncbi:hypothetical protein HCN44_000561 [Aphidius gifuensis]|uniref:Cation/H+ exchanger transmembrane domain-containing protein n=1 Tax=Aphidius gifuensis TaxID=684658 RepID=A0A834XR76_APHGI|nr:hypothetical protein HCN44_000561 [Aphidius gifuensis]
MDLNNIETHPGRIIKNNDEICNKIRRVSISDQIIGIDNPTFEHNRAISPCSQHDNNEIVRKKSILHNTINDCIDNQQQIYNTENGRINGQNRKKSAMSLSSSIREKIEYTDQLKSSWLYLFCTRCHGKDDTPSWEPTGWHKLCPSPFCPSYRKFSRIISLLLLGLMTWGITYAIIGDDAAPGGPLFSIAVLAIIAHFVGWIFSLTTLPALIGMLMTGIVMQNFNLIKIDHKYAPVISVLRKIALVIILTRAGLDLDPNALKKQKITMPKLAMVPWLVEGSVVAITAKYLLELEWIWCFLIGSIVAAVSPAVVVPCLFRLRGKGYGVAKPFMVPLRVLMLLGGGLIAVFGSEAIELGGAGPLAVVAAAFVSCYFWQKDGWEVDDNPVAISFEIFWMLFEPILFSITGTEIKIDQLNSSKVYLIVGCLVTAIIMRMITTVFVGIGSKLNMKEKIFIAFACMAKATVQAALGPATLDEIDKNNKQQIDNAQTTLTFCVLSIILTAPIGAIIISLSGPKLLTKIKTPIPPTNGWRTRRPSIRDISIINEDPDLEESAGNGKP